MATDHSDLPEKLKALRETIDTLPRAQDAEQLQAAEALEALMQSLTKLVGTVEAIDKDIDDRH